MEAIHTCSILELIDQEAKKQKHSNRYPKIILFHV